ncbi:protein of unknown function [Methylorubrum extorquens]|uniref:Uncharacterized protein n=1 Tax=Methylorubrum extorquens TaxID=408 RepID=A0A2N9ARN5_METEX|nr:protein of unknown function [Methylorubrum extorquens]
MMRLSYTLGPRRYLNMRGVISKESDRRQGGCDQL